MSGVIGTLQLAEDSQRHRLRATFDTVAEGYEDARPVAPAQVFDDLVELARCEPRRTPARDRLRHRTGDDCRLPSAASRSWPSTWGRTSRSSHATSWRRTRRSRSSRRRSRTGTQAASSSMRSSPSTRSTGSTPTFGSRSLRQCCAPADRSACSAPHSSCTTMQTRRGSRSSEDHEAVTGAADPRRHVDDLRDRSGDFTAGGYFSSVIRKTYRSDLTYDADRYVALLATMSTYRALQDDVREELFERVSGDGSRRAAAPSARRGPTCSTSLTA